MLELGEGPQQYLSLFFDAPTFCAFRFTCSKLHKSLNVDHECYYFARVKYISYFRLNKDSTTLTSYKIIFGKIISLHSMSGNLYQAIISSEELIELVFKTPTLLERLFDDAGPLYLINFLRLRPFFHPYVFMNPSIVLKFLESESNWVSSFTSLISLKTQVYNGLIDSDEMMLALAFSCRSYCNNHITLCEILEKHYQAPKVKIDSVLYLKTPAIEVELQNRERAKAIYDLLKSLKPFEPTESTAQRLEL